MVQVVKRALDILQFVNKAPDREAGLGEIAAAVKLNAATCARILKTLVAEGFVEQMGAKKGYILGSASYALGSGSRFRADLLIASEPSLALLSGELNETALVAAHQGTQRIVVAQKDSSRDIQVRSDLSQNPCPYTSATGRLLFAYLSDRLRNIFLASHGMPEKNDWPEASTPKLLKIAISKIVKDGFSIRKEGNIVGIAYPVFASGIVTGALGCFLPAFRFDGSHKIQVLAALEREAGVISRNMGDENECQ